VSLRLAAPRVHDAEPLIDLSISIIQKHPDHGGAVKLRWPPLQS